jgi:uncharacterized protein YecT (DUF1311 family)
MGGEPASADSENPIFLPYKAMKKDVVFCLESEDFPSDPKSCARASFKTCMTEWKESDSRVKEGNCNEHEFLIWRELYQEQVIEVLQDAQKTDRDAAADRNPDIDAFSQILNRELRWQEFRESECSYKRSLTMGGTDGVSIYWVCLAEMTAQRIVFLSARSQP